jgi:hypothetical protein
MTGKGNARDEDWSSGPPNYFAARDALDRAALMLAGDKRRNSRSGPLFAVLRFLLDHAFYTRDKSRGHVDPRVSSIEMIAIMTGQGKTTVTAVLKELGPDLDEDGDSTGMNLITRTHRYIPGSVKRLADDIYLKFPFDWQTKPYPDVSYTVASRLSESRQPTDTNSRETADKNSRAATPHISRETVDIEEIEDLEEGSKKAPPPPADASVGSATQQVKTQNPRQYSQEVCDYLDEMAQREQYGQVDLEGNLRDRINSWELEREPA